MKKILVKPSAQFRKNTTSAVLSIFLFILVYFLMVIAAFGILGLCVLGAVGLISFYFNFPLLMLSFGIVSLGVLIVLFLFKFLFKSFKSDRSHLVELDLDSQPKLKTLLEDIVMQVGTQFPKRVYLSNEVNASVFYDSNLLSMIFPTRKNLTIGMGLVNTLNLEEFKAVLAHEFGHFSQRSMKVGSYVYYVNEVIYNLLYENDSYQSLASKWADISGYFSIFVGLAFKVAQGAQWILKGMYSVVNKNFMALSREMEFHADEIAANVTGGDPLADSFSKFGPASYALQDVFNYYDGELQYNRIPKNIYTNHRFVMNFLASQKREGFVNIQSDLVVKDQWASHPSDEDRIQRLKLLGIPTKNQDSAPASSCFTAIADLEALLTSKLLSNFTLTGEVEAIREEKFEEDYQRTYLKFSFPKIFNGYYDYRNPSPLDKETAITEKEFGSFEKLFSSEVVSWVSQLVTSESDLATVSQIADGSYVIKSFDYRGKRYKKSEARSVMKLIKERIATLKNQLAIHDQKIFSFFAHRERELHKPPLLEGYYAGLVNLDKEQSENQKLISELNARLEFTSYNTPFVKIKSNFREIKKDEAKLKEKINSLLEDNRFEKLLSAELVGIFEQYISKEWEYFGNEIYYQDNLNLLLNSLEGFSNLQSMMGFMMKKGMLEYQESLLDFAELSAGPISSETLNLIPAEIPKPMENGSIDAIG
ncbi:M48 family metalloprotease [Algoriphagus sp. AGSA1]|uniref:M48 family metalloprotease n=1 Tax=Algoriphagus sp. AGSA1 TaxID=2907213 RepID=UPI001F302860|nr:M48 family metallopeptidase [Algoriphagus sp. AGSA1]MCE7055887.1 M48 family metalloprotease [Algoriphagus sp. AGSA1]